MHLPRWKHVQLTWTFAEEPDVSLGKTWILGRTVKAFRNYTNTLIWHQTVFLSAYDVLSNTRNNRHHSVLHIKRHPAHGGIRHLRSTSWFTWSVSMFELTLREEFMSNVVNIMSNTSQEQYYYVDSLLSKLNN